MTCPIEAKDLIINRIQKEVYTNPLTTALTLGSTYPAEQAVLSVLDDIGVTYGSSLYRLNDTGSEFTYTISIPDRVVDSYVQTAGKTPYAKANRASREGSELEAAAAALRSRISTDSREINRLADSVVLSAKRVSSSRVQDADVREAMSAVWASIQADDSGEAKVRMMANYISEAANVSEERLRNLRDVLPADGVYSDSDVALIAAYENDVLPYKATVADFSQFMAGAPDNAVKRIIDRAAIAIEEIENIGLRAKEQSAYRDLLDTARPALEKARKRLEADIAGLEERKAGLSPKQRIAVDKKITKMREDFDRLSPTDENLHRALRNEMGMSIFAGLDKFVLAGAMNPDLVVQGFTKKVKEAYGRGQDAFRQIGAGIEQEYAKLLDSGFSDTNVDAAFSELYEEVVEYRFNDTTGEIEEDSALYFASDTSHQWRTEFSRLKAEFQRSANDLRTAMLAGEPVRELEEAHVVAKEAYYQWRRANFESLYDARYNATDAILDTRVNYEGSETTLREIRSRFYDEISDIQAAYMATSGVPSADDVAQIEHLREQFEAVKSLSGKVEGTEEYRIASLFTQHAAQMKEMTERWEISPEAQNRFSQQKASVDARYESGEISKEERDNWYTTNTTTVYSERYWQERRDTVAEIQQLSEEVSRITGGAVSADMKGAYESMESICRKYRDHNSHINGAKLTSIERQQVWKFEEQIEATKREVKSAYSKFLGTEFEDMYADWESQRKDLLDRIKEVKAADPSYSRDTQAQVSELRKQLRELRGSEKGMVSRFLAERGFDKAQIDAFHAVYSRYRAAIKHLSELTDSVETKAYYETYGKELQKFAASKTAEELAARVRKTTSIRAGSVKYVKGKDGNFYEEMYDGSLGTEVYPPAFLRDVLFKKDFEQSEWFRQNHFKAEKWRDGEQAEVWVPIYSWRISQPSDKKFIKEHSPNIAWKRRVIKDEYRRLDVRLDNGLPPIKKSLWENTSYEDLRRNKPALWQFRDYMIGVQQTADEVYPPEQRLGMRVPTIERNLSLYDAVQRGFTGVPTQVGRMYTLNEQDRDELVAHSDEEGFERKFIPVRFQGRLSAPLVSRNIVQTVGQYAGQAAVYQEKVGLAQVGANIMGTLNQQNHAPSSEVLDKLGAFFGMQKMVKSRGTNQRLDTVRAIMDMFVYGEMTSEETQAGKRMHKIIGNLLGFRAAAIFSELPNAAAVAMGGKGTIGGTIWPQLVNWFGGTTQQLIKTASTSANINLNAGALVWAKATYYKNSGTFLRDTGRLVGRSYWTRFAEFFDAEEQAYIDNFGEQVYSKGILRNINSSAFSFFKQAVEHELMMTTIMAWARSKSITTEDGPILLSDAFEVSGGEFVQKQGVSIPDEEIVALRGEIAALLRDINGNYGKLDKVYAETFWLAKTMFFMRKWLIPMFVARYGAKKFSLEQGDVVEGYLRQSFGVLFQNKGRGALALAWAGFDPTLTEGQKDALRKTRTEIAIMALMYFTYRLVLGYDPEDEKRFEKLRKEEYALQGLTYALVKGTSEVSTFVPPFGVDEGVKVTKNLTDNLFPVVGDLWGILSKDITYDLDPTTPVFDTYQRSTGLHEKGDVKAAAHLLRLLGRTDSKADPVEALKTFETTLRK